MRLALMSLLLMPLVVGCGDKHIESYEACTFTATTEAEDACAPVRHVYVSPEAVIDGDSFELSSMASSGDDVDVANIIRFLGAEAPELEGLGTEQCYAEEATEYLRSLIGGRTIRLEFDEECTGVFGRTLAHVFIEAERGDPLRDDLVDLDLDWGGVDEDGCINVLVSEVMVRSGHSRVWPPYDWKYVDRLLRAEGLAEDEGLGLWSACPPMK